MNSAANILLAGLGMVSGILAARLLGSCGRGELAAIQTWPTFIAGLAALGMPEALVYYTAREPAEAGRYLGSAVVIGIISSLPFMVAGYALMPLLLHAQTAKIVGAGRRYLLVIPIFILIGLPRHPMQGRRDFVPWNAMRIAPNVLWIAVLGLAWACSCATPTFLATANLVAFALLILPFGALAVLRLPGPFRPAPQKWPSLLSYGLPCTATMLPQTLNARLDQMLMAALLPPQQLGLYVVAVAWSGAAVPLLGALGSVTFPAVASATNEQQRVQRFASGGRVAAALTLTSTVALTAVTPLAIVVLFGAKFRHAVPVALVLVPAAGVLGLNFVLQEGLRGLGQPYAVLQAELAGLAVTVVGLAAMLPSLGIMGAGLSSLLGYSTVTAVLLLNAQRHTGAKASDLLLPDREDLRCALGSVVAVVRGLMAKREKSPVVSVRS